MANWELSLIYRERGNVPESLERFRRVLKLDSASAHDFTLLMEYHEMFKSTKPQMKNGIIAFRTAWQWHLDTFNGPRDAGPMINPNADIDEEQQGQDGDDENEEALVPRYSNTMSLEHLIAFVDLLLEQDQLEEAVDVIKKGQRWMQGRIRAEPGDWAGTEAEDDREYDPQDHVRPDAAERIAKAKKAAKRKAVKNGDMEEESEEADERPKRFPLVAVLRYRLALIRLRLGHTEEAEVSGLHRPSVRRIARDDLNDNEGDANVQLHLTCVLSLDEERYEQIFIDLGNEVVKRQNWTMGARLFARLNDNPNARFLPLACMGT